MHIKRDFTVIGFFSFKSRKYFKNSLRKLQCNILLFTKVSIKDKLRYLYLKHFLIKKNVYLDNHSNSWMNELNFALCENKILFLGGTERQLGPHVH